MCRRSLPSSQAVSESAKVAATHCTHEHEESEGDRGTRHECGLSAQFVRPTTWPTSDSI